MKKIILLILVALFTSITVQAKELIVGVNQFEPFIMTSKNNIDGFSIDFWNAVSKEANIREFKFKVYPNVSEKLKALQSGEIDVAIGGITATSEREKLFDFTSPTFNTGLDILVKSDNTSSGRALFKALLPLAKKLIFILLIVVIVIAHIIWIADRGKPNFNDNYFPGIFEGIYWTVVTGATVGYGDYVPGTWPARVVAIFTMLFFIPLFCWFQAQTTAFVTVNQLKTEVRGIEDLKDKKISTISNTSAEFYMKNINSVDVVGYPTIKEAINALNNNKVSAVVYDAPNLNYMSSKDSKSGLVVVGNEFNKQSFAYALPKGSALRKDLNIAILKIQESGMANLINDKWFKKD